MANITEKGNLFPAKIVSEIITKVSDASALAKMSTSEPVPFSGKEYMTLSIDGEANIVGEGDPKPAGEATVTTKTLPLLKLVFQHRVSDEFMKASEEDRIPYLRAFADGFAGKIARGMDIAAIYGVNPGNGEDTSFKETNSFASTDIATVTDEAADDALRDAIAAVTASKGVTSGIVMSTKLASDLGKIKANGIVQYPEFDFGGTPETFKGKKLAVTTNLSYKEDTDAVVGDFDYFKWGYSAGNGMSFDVIPYGDPDGLGDLKQHNQVCLRGEAYLGFIILDPTKFARVTADTESE